jgi:steroid 5-alpha reductase family enzyme
MNTLTFIQQTYIYVAHGIALYMILWFIVAIVRKRNDVADTAWGIGFFVASCIPLFLYGIQSIQQIIVTLLVLIWGSRLSLHIHLRNRNKSEDPRYLAWRQSWKWFYTRSFFQIFILQGLLLILVVSPVLFINTYAVSEITYFFYAGLVIWGIGFFFESVGDAQLKKFIQNPDNKGKIMNQGLWAYTRHPNYFGEVTQWWGLFIIALSVPQGIWSIIGPLTITILILKVSGIPMLEKSFIGKPGWEEYKAKTSAFIPWFRE